LLMAWMPPPTGIVMCHCDVSESNTQRESIHVRSHYDRHRPCKARVSRHRACANGTVIFRKKLTRVQRLEFMSQQPTCLVAMEACATAHCWGREIETPGHTVRLIAPKYVKPLVKRQKNDVADAEAIVEAASRPTMRFVALKSEAQ
jgi:transposase